MRVVCFSISGDCHIYVWTQLQLYKEDKIPVCFAIGMCSPKLQSEIAKEAHAGP